MEIGWRAIRRLSRSQADTLRAAVLQVGLLFRLCFPAYRTTFNRMNRSTAHGALADRSLVDRDIARLFS